MPSIRLLKDHIVSQIAAGEVVERPSSVLKELVENALDSTAQHLRVELETGGKRLVEVSDDGHGMDREDALLAFDRHATSKIVSFEDLQAVATLGFRGEALASIAAVSKVDLVTAESDGEAWRVRIDGERILGVEPASRSRGTTIAVRSLFFNVPARRKFLKRTTTELRRCVEVVQGYALARPEVGFELRHEGRALLRTEATSFGVEGLRERIQQIFGRDLTGHLVEIPSSDLAGGGLAFGLLGDRDTARGRRIFVFVNRRLIRDRAVLATFYRAVREQWKSDDFPALFLFLELPAEEVDVNVHPQKAEVRFRDPRFLSGLSEMLATGLARARGEEPAPLRELQSGTSPPALAWTGLGRSEDRHSWWRSGEVRESFDSGAAGGKLAEPSYALSSQSSVRLSGRGSSERSLRLLGQYKGTLMLFEGSDALYLIDQHVAHERVLFERIRSRLASDLPQSQTLLEPLVLSLSAAESLCLHQWVPVLEDCGFSMVEMAGSTLGIASIPAELRIEEAERLMRRLATGEREAEEDGGALKRSLLETLAASMSCRAAVKMHHPLSPREMEELVAELFVAEQPYACPHGRPIVLKMDDRDLERRFGRS